MGYRQRPPPAPLPPPPPIPRNFHLPRAAAAPDHAPRSLCRCALSQPTLARTRARMPMHARPRVRGSARTRRPRSARADHPRIPRTGIPVCADWFCSMVLTQFESTKTCAKTLAVEHQHGNARCLPWQPWLPLCTAPRGLALGPENPPTTQTASCMLDATFLCINSGNSDTEIFQGKADAAPGSSGLAPSFHRDVSQ